MHQGTYCIEYLKTKTCLLCFFFLSRHRIRGLVKAKALHEQVAGMEKIAGQMKANKEQVYQQIHQLKQSIDQLIHDIAVSFIKQKKNLHSKES